MPIAPSTPQYTMNQIRQAFAQTDKLRITTRGPCEVGRLQVWVPTLGPFHINGTALLSSIDVSPESLRAVFAGQIVQVLKTRAWYFFSWKIVKDRYQEVTVPLPAEVISYNDFGRLPLDPVYYGRLAQLIGKSLVVLNQDCDGEVHPYCTIQASGLITVCRVK